MNNTAATLLVSQQEWHRAYKSPALKISKGSLLKDPAYHLSWSNLGKMAEQIGLLNKISKAVSMTPKKMPKDNFSDVRNFMKNTNHVPL